MPTIIDAWYIVPKRPRIAGGETSATYIGDSSEPPPTASPARNRDVTRAVKFGDKAVAIDVPANSSAISSSPRRSVSLPATMHPSAQPNNRELNAQPSP